MVCLGYKAREVDPAFLHRHPFAPGINPQVPPRHRSHLSKAPLPGQPRELCSYQSSSVCPWVCFRLPWRKRDQSSDKVAHATFPVRCCPVLCVAPLKRGWEPESQWQMTGLGTEACGAEAAWHHLPRALCVDGDKLCILTVARPQVLQGPGWMVAPVLLCPLITVAQLQHSYDQRTHPKSPLGQVWYS